MNTYPSREFFTDEHRKLLATLNYDESRITPYTLPDVLSFGREAPIRSASQWEQELRPELLQQIGKYIYGKMLPAAPIQAVVTEESKDALQGKATRRQVTVISAGIRLNLIIYIPNNATQPAPCFLGMNFSGNHASFADPAVLISDTWIGNHHPGVIDHLSTEDSRGTKTSRWPLEAIIERGYALATLYYGDAEPDHPCAFSQSPRSRFLRARNNDEREPEDAGAITAWAWGLSRCMDYLTTVSQIDATRVCLTGHSRLGKTVLWAAANDRRFALVVANNSGCGGASPSRRNFGEVLHILSNVRTHWFCKNCMHLSEDMSTFPVDSHMLLALIAPRPLLISCAENDLAADPKGEFEAAQAASPVYQLLGTDGLQATQQPPLKKLVGSRIGYWIRPGEHNITPEDWDAHLDFADKHLKSGK